MMLSGCISFGFTANDREAGADLVRRMVESLTKREDIVWATGIANPSAQTTTTKPGSDPEALFNE